jgi:hypothetical protein
VGTGAQIVSPKDAPEPDPRGHTHLYRAATADPPGLWYSMAAIQNAGLALEWVRKVLGVSWEEVYAEAFAVPPGAGGVVFLPYLSGERTPRFDPGARGAWTGLGLDHDRGYLLRAALEGVAFALREGLEALESAGIPVTELRLAAAARASPGGNSLRTCSATRCGCCQRTYRPLPQPAARRSWPDSHPVRTGRPKTRSSSPRNQDAPYIPARRALTTRSPMPATGSSTRGCTARGAKPGNRQRPADCERSRYAARYPLLHYA